MKKRPAISASVREVVAFVLRSGDLGRSGQFAGPDRALEGTRGHQRLQKQRPADYAAEVRVQWEHADELFDFTLKGRIDGVIARPDLLLVEEIKTVRGRLPAAPDPLHLGQAKIYASLQARTLGYRHATVQITYLELNSEETIHFEARLALDDLQSFFESVLQEYLDWLRDHQRWCAHRDETIRHLAFPFAGYRPGQRSFAVAVYRAIQASSKLFAEAPTGIGKTVSVLFPAIKAMGEQLVEKIFYVTAKTSGRAVAEQTLRRLTGAGLSLRWVALTARDKICFNNGQPCDLKTCPYALGYYDRIKNALRDALSTGAAFARVELEALARQHQVCPFELSLDLSLWVDAVICDYNYVFDRSVALERYFDGEKHDYAILIDEAHNLLDRAREIFSADLSEARDALEAEVPSCAKALGKVCSVLRSISRDEGWMKRETAFVNPAPPVRIGPAIQRFLETAESWLMREEPSPVREILLPTYFRLLGFKNTLELFNERFITLYEPGAQQLRLFCLDPSELLRETLLRTGSAVLFSATLRPIPFFRAALGGDPTDPVLALDSPFPPENLQVLLQDRIATRWQSRSATYGAVVESIAAFVSTRPGNYLVFFPSYAYLAEVQSRFAQAYLNVRLETQTLGMTEPQREQFLEKFQAGTNETLVAFAVLGGIFGEGIDLVGDRLIGVVIVGVGLPQICLERDLIKEQAQKQGLPGFDYAYTYPGINRVLQGLGRVIRSETDRGVILLIDDRFAQAPYRDLLPTWWTPQPVRSPEEITQLASKFWLKD